MKTGVELIAAERQRQIEVEKFDIVNDEGYDILQLSAAAGCYIANACNKFFYQNTHTEEVDTSRFQVLEEGEKNKWVDGWPWSKEWDKREKHDIHRSLEIAGALIAAELDRINGAISSPASPVQGSVEGGLKEVYNEEDMRECWETAKVNSGLTFKTYIDNIAR